jgi:hypothetical protein
MSERDNTCIYCGAPGFTVCRRCSWSGSEVVDQPLLPAKDAVPDWQDISTAPRDGTDVLIGLGDTIAIGFYCPENDPRLPPGWIWAGEDLWFRCEPTHWMPLPAPPKEVG